MRCSGGALICVMTEISPPTASLVRGAEHTLRGEASTEVSETVDNLATTTAARSTQVRSPRVVTAGEPWVCTVLCEIFWRTSAFAAE